MKTIFITGVLLALTACAGLIQTGTLNDVHKSYQDKNHDETLKLIRLAENINELSPELKAELTYLKALTYEEMGQHEQAKTLYQYLKEHHKASQYSYLAAKRLEK